MNKQNTLAIQQKVDSIKYYLTQIKDINIKDLEYIITRPELNEEIEPKYLESSGKISSCIHNIEFVLSELEINTTILQTLNDKIFNIER